MTSDYVVMREKMVDGQLRPTDVTDTVLLSAMLAVPRELFVPENKRSLAYIDEDLEVAPGRFLMEPSPFAKLIQLAEIAPGDRVLDVACATGYSTAVLARLAGSVVALESDPALAASAASTLAALGVGNARVETGPLPAGWAPAAPYDVVVIGGAVEAVPDALLDQLAEGGRLVAVEGRGNAGVARVHVRTGDVVSARRAFNAAVKPLSEFERAPEFEF